MEEVNDDPFRINSNVDVRNTFRTSNLYLNKKRKSQDENSGLPLPKHMCLVKSSISEPHFPLVAKLDTEDLSKSIREGKHDNSQGRYGQTEDGSAKDSNCFSEDEDSVMSVSDDSKTELQHLRICPYDLPSTSSVNWVGSSSNASINSLDSKLERKTTDFLHSNFNLYPFSGIEEYYVGCGNSIECDSSEYRTRSNEDCEDEELENFLYSSRVIPNNFVLSSGRWDVNQDAQHDTEKLTIDKEFEQYFSTLMLE